MRVLLTLQYLGTSYAGWQSQTNATGVQTVVEEALARMYRQSVRIEGASRTDAGVHANAQRAHFEPPFEIPHRGIVLGVNDLLPSDIRIVAAETVADDFHCRFAAREKEYAYRIWNGPVMDVFRAATHAHIASPIEVDAMSQAAAALVGEHDFRSFTVAEPEVSSTVRTVTAVRVICANESGSGDRAAVSDLRSPSPARTIEIRISATGYLRYMVRRIAGTLIEIGRGRLPVEAVARALEPAFEEARWTAPAKGLVLEEVRY